MPATTMEEARELVKKLFALEGKGGSYLHCANCYCDLRAFYELVTPVVHKGVKTDLVEYDGKLWDTYNPCEYGLSVVLVGKMNDQSAERVDVKTQSGLGDMAAY